jgi:nitrite reductase (NADH) small subunit
MGEYVVARVGDIPAGKIKVTELNGKSIGVCNWDGKFYSILNYCPHQGGPLCEGGSLFPKISAEITPKGKVREYHDNENMVVSCPWHGWEFDVQTGRCLADANRRVLTYETKVQDDEVIVVFPD